MRRFQALVKMLFTCGLFCVLVGLIIFRFDDIQSILDNHVFKDRNDVSIGEVNEYYRDYDFEFVQRTDDLYPKNYQELLNVFYTILNAGKKEFTFYCDREYENCINDVTNIANDQELLSTINNYVHPYNGFSHIETEYDNLGRVTIEIIKSYNKEQIVEINSQIDSLYPVLIQENQTTEDNIRAVHDYIINHTIYDSNRSDNQVEEYASDIAYGPLFEGYALCGGYTDLMELFLERMGIKSFKVSSKDHVWNAIYLNDQWYHLDATWDDPVSTDGKNYLEHTYFLIDTQELKEIDPYQHEYINEYYPEIKEVH